MHTVKTGHTKLQHSVFPSYDPQMNRRSRSTLSREILYDQCWKNQQLNSSQWLLTGHELPATPETACLYQCSFMRNKTFVDINTLNLNLCYWTVLTICDRKSSLIRKYTEYQKLCIDICFLILTEVPESLLSSLKRVTFTYTRIKVQQRFHITHNNIMTECKYEIKTEVISSCSLIKTNS